VPSFRGYSGLVVIPTADTMTQGEYNMGVMTEDVGDFHASDIFANFSPTNNLEVGFNSTLLRGAKDRETLPQRQVSDHARDRQPRGNRIRLDGHD